MLLHQKAQADLRRALAMRGADTGQHLIVTHAAARDRTVGDHRHALLSASSDQRRLVEERMTLELITDQRFAADLHRLFDLRHAEVGDADVTRQSVALGLAQHVDRFGKRQPLARPVQQQKIDLGQRNRARHSRVARSNSRGAKWVGQIFVVTKTSSRLTPELRKPSPTSRSLSYISAVSTWR